MQITLKQERVVSVETTTLTLPLWMQYAVDGQRINAIKALREVARTDSVTGYKLGLGQAKDIVDNFCQHIAVTKAQV